MNNHTELVNIHSMFDKIQNDKNLTIKGIGIEEQRPDRIFHYRPLQPPADIKENDVAVDGYPDFQQSGTPVGA